VALLGCGAFGDTWRHGDTAVKIICLDGYPSARVAREVEGLLRVRSPHVVRLLDFSTVELGQRQRPALRFEFIPGGDIAERMQASRWPTTEECIALLHGLLTGVKDLHASGTVHRDIKPGNIALRNGDWGKPVLLDLGLARGKDDVTITAYPGPVGTLLYMAPEQLHGRRARKAADLFSVGATVRQLISQRHPFYDGFDDFDASDAYKKARARIDAGPVPLPATIPKEINDLLDRLVSPVEHERGSAPSSLRRLDRAQER
jgi:serine/threonine protein kinase